MGQAEKSPWVKTFSERLSEASQGVSQANLSKTLGIGQSNVSMYLKGDRVPSLEVFRSLCLALGVKSDWLLGITNTQKGDGGDSEMWRGVALASHRKLDKVNEALGKIIEGTKALQEAVK